ncbi:MAG: hypothetical protein ACI4FW_03350 [Bariatricus sp.]
MVRNYLISGEKVELNNRQYTIDKVAGEGATCIVYSATYVDDRNHPHRVNIKECYPYKANIVRDGHTILWNSEEEREQSFEKFYDSYDKLINIQNVAKLNNSTAHGSDICEANGTLYYVLDFNDGKTFEEDDCSVQDALKTVKALAETVGKYHKNRYLHLDIKPSNFLTIDETRELVVLFDMDTVVCMDDIKAGKVNIVPYSKNWAAPELKRGLLSKLCPATDIYAIGAILFEKVMGRKVDASDSTVLAEWDFDNEKLENLNPKIKRLLRNIFAKTLSANIKRRYQSIDALVKDLEKAIQIANTDIYIKGMDIVCDHHFVGRTNELQLIEQSFKEKKKAVFLHGIGGIGKTEISKKYAENHKSDYDVILFIRYNNKMSLQEHLDEIDIINFDGEMKERRKQLIRLLDEHTLVIIDNFDIAIGSDNGLRALFDTNAKVIVSTRTDFSFVYNGEKYLQIEVDPLETSNIMELFVHCSRMRSVNETQKEIIEKILKIIENHTYAAELLAKQVDSSGWTVDELYKRIKEGLETLIGSEKVIASKDDEILKDNSFNILRAVVN